jgi:hypothetical protein
MCEAGRRWLINRGGLAMQPNKDDLPAMPVSSLREQSMAAFYRNLPELLKKHYGKWVAYHGDELVGVGGSQTKLYELCRRRGLKDDEFDVLFADNLALGDNEEIALSPDR